MSQLNCVVELSQQMRTKDKRYLKLLNRLRSGQSTIEDYELLCTRNIGNTNHEESLQQTSWSEVCRAIFHHTLLHLLC